MLKLLIYAMCFQQYAMAKRSVQTTLFGTVVCEAEGCIYTNPKGKYEQLSWILNVHDVHDV